MSKTLIISALASVDLTGKEGYGVKATGNGSVELAAAATDEICGVVVQGDAANQQVAVALPGAIANVKLSGTVKAMDAGKVAADGTFLKSTLAQNDVVCVRFLEAGVSGDLVQSLVLESVKHA
jgi:hypothetical protein